MKLKVVDLQCPKCYKKVKKLLCKFPRKAPSAASSSAAAVSLSTAEGVSLSTAEGVSLSAAGVSLSTAEDVSLSAAGVSLFAAGVSLSPPKVCHCPPPGCHCPPRAGPPLMVVPIGVCCGPCYEGRPGGPCFHGYSGGRPCYVSRCDEYFCEENTSACTIM
ncbi:proline-rich protein 2 [Spatholobus suberectus]|nr:proline-rich protein 2 [Spatholobus suberectus]